LTAGIVSRPVAAPARLMIAALAVAGLAGCSGSPAATSGRAASVTSAAGRSASPTPSSTRPAVMARSIPTRLRIPAIDVSAALTAVGLEANGTLEVPRSGSPAGWFTGAPTPGERGPAIIVGHIDWKGREGVFGRLHSLKPGARILVSRKDGTVAEFEVTAVRHFAKEHFPTRLVYGNLNRSALRLVTCGGAFNRQTRSYEDNIVAFAELV
jgi:sortase (surface protein transpeptidase)